MRKGLPIIALSFMVALLNCPVVHVSEAFAADIKIAYIDSERLFAESVAKKTVEGQFATDLEGWVKQLEAKKADLDKLQRDFEAQRHMLSDARRKEREDEILARQSEYNQLSQEIWGPTGKVAQRNEQLTRPVIQKIKEAVQKIALQEGYQLVLDAADGNLVYGAPELDLTDRVLAELNRASTGGTSP